MFIAATFAVIAALGLFLIARGRMAKAGDIAGTATTTAAALTDLAHEVGKEIGPGSFTEYAELKGRAVGDPPFRADYSGTECVWYDCKAVREYEEDYIEDGEDGHHQTKTRKGSEEVSRILREAPFWLEDSTGRIRVDPAGAVIEAVKSFSKFEPETGLGTLKIGSFSIGLPGQMGGRRTLGYRLEERSIPVERELYVLGEATDAGGTLRLKKPSGKGKRFIISTRSEEAIVAGAKKGALWLTISAGVAAAAAIGFALAGIFKG